MKRRSIKNEVIIHGKGLHMGCEAEVKLKPAKAGSGIKFIRIDLDKKPVISADVKNLFLNDAIQRCTAIGFNEEAIYTVEHLMSALCGLGITDLELEINNVELPGLDGSSLNYCQRIQEAGVVELDEEAEVFQVIEPVGVAANGASIFITPADDLRISYTLSYPHPQLFSQFFQSEINQEIYLNQIAPCRTFCLEKEAKELQKAGMGKGANYQNTLVVGDEGVIENEVRFQDEFARHKVLDFIGDLYLLGVPIKGHVFATKSGHYLNIQLLKKIAEQRERFLRRATRSNLEVGLSKEIGIEQIMKVLPHRYPFLLVDKVYEIEKGKKGIGVKNVTVNDNFFQGHFPTRPIMPGVLMVEAMAQTAGVIILTSEAHRGKVAFFMATDKVKFRKPVVPGDQLIMEVEVIKDRSRIAQVRAVSKVNEDVVAEADMTFSFTDASYLD